MKHKTNTIELKEGSLVVVFEGLKKVESGPYAGETTLGSFKVYLGTEQVGLLQSFRIEAHANEPLPKIEFDFGSALPEPDARDPELKTTQEEAWGRLRDTYQRYVDSIRKFIPWAKWTSPVELSPPPEDGEVHERVD